jgi:hypothetical protein
VKILDMAWVKKDKMQRPQGSDCAYRVGVERDLPMRGPGQHRPSQYSGQRICFVLLVPSFLPYEQVPLVKGLDTKPTLFLIYYILF